MGIKQIVSTVTSTDEELEKHLNFYGLQLNEERQVRWKHGNKDHPRNWPFLVKCYGVGMITFLDFFTTAVGTAGVPISEAARDDLNIRKTSALVCFTSVYLFGQGIGSIVFPPYSESFGRRNLYIVSTFLYTVFCLLIAAVPRLPMIIVGRFLTGFFSSIPTIIVEGSIEDMFNSEARVWAIFLWLTTANVGLIVGTIMGWYISLFIGWRWVFWIAGIVTFIATLLLFGMRESRPSRILEQKVQKIRTATGNDSLKSQNPDHTPSIRTFVSNALIRPLYLYKEPIVLIVSIMSAIAFGLVYLFTEALQVVYAAYNFSPEQCSLALIPMAIGLCLGGFTRLYDIRLAKKRKAMNEKLTPEDKLTGFIIAAPVLAVALWWFAWTIPPKVKGVHWIVSMIALIPVGFAVNEFDCVLAGYLADSYTIFSASAFASLSMLRSLFSATFPLFGRQMYSNLDSNRANSVIAGIATLACISPWVFAKYGKRIRQSSKFAQHSLKVHDENFVSEFNELDDISKA